MEVSLLWRATFPCGARGITTPRRNPSPKPRPETLKSPNRGVCMWKCPCCGVPRFLAERTASRPHPETPPRNPETPPRNLTPKPGSLQIEECACGSVLAVACHVSMRGACHHDPTPKPHPETPKPHPEACVSDVAESLACVSDACVSDVIVACVSESVAEASISTLKTNHASDAPQRLASCGEPLS